MKKIILILLTFSSILSSKSQSVKEKMEQDIKQIFNYIKTDNITELKKHLITKSIFKDYLREQIQLTSQEDFKLKMKEAYEKQLNKKISKEELDKHIDKTRIQLEEMLNDNNQLNDFFKSMGIQDEYDIENTYIIRQKNRKKYIDWKKSNLFYYLYGGGSFILGSGIIVFHVNNTNDCYVIRTNMIELNKSFYYSLGDIRHAHSCDILNDKDIKNYNIIDFRKKKFANNKKKVIKQEQVAKNEIIDKQLQTAKMYYTKKDYENAFVWYQKAANDNNVIAQYQLGYMYRKGLGTRKSRKNAKIWWKKACKQGHKKSCKEIEKMNAFGNAFLKAVVNSMAESSNNGNSSTSRANTGFVGRWKSDMGPNFGASSRLIITRINGGYKITLDGKSYVGKLNPKTGRIDFKGYRIEYDKSKDLLELLPSMSVYKRY